MRPNTNSWSAAFCIVAVLGAAAVATTIAWNSGYDKADRRVPFDTVTCRPKPGSRPAAQRCLDQLARTGGLVLFERDFIRCPNGPGPCLARPARVRIDGAYLVGTYASTQIEAQGRPGAP